ncbi:MAG: hypothetical protein H0T92_17205 [Pyrinomonadaceae bacterium]|nr:hypothetical protein [Pyrinomonadaceae bacterium]
MRKGKQPIPKDANKSGDIPLVLQPQSITRTHRAFGLFPSALLLSGYGESEVEKNRSFTITEKQVGGDEVIERRFEMFTKSEMGLPRGRDPHVLVSLLKLLFSKNEVTNSVWFRKSELLNLLGWTDNAENRADIDGAISRYFDTAYRGMSLQTDSKRVRERERVRRLLIGYDKVDERKVRHAADKTPDAEESGRLFTRVIFDPDFINDLRSEELSLSTDINVLRVLNVSNLASRLYEVLNYFTNEGKLDFKLEIKQLAHERLGISRKIAAPSQCWQKIAHSFEKLQKADYLTSYDYDGKTGFISGQINRKFVPPHQAALPPLPTNDERRTHLKKRFTMLGTYPNAASSVLKKLPDELLGEAELIADRIEQIKIDNIGKGKDFKWGGWAYNELVNLHENGYINPNLLDGTQTPTETSEPTVAPGAGDVPLSKPPKVVCVDERAAALWSRITAKLAKHLSPHVLTTWFGEDAATPVKLVGQNLVVYAANPVVKDWVNSNYADILREAVNEAAGKKIRVEIVWRTDTDEDEGEQLTLNLAR